MDKVSYEDLPGQMCAKTHLLGMEIGMFWSLRMVVLMGAILSTRPVTTEAPLAVRSSTLSPTTKGRDRNCMTTAHAAVHRQYLTPSSASPFLVLPVPTNDWDDAHVDSLLQLSTPAAVSQTS